MSDDLPVVRIVTAKAPGDCAIVTMAMYLGREYEDVLAASVHDTDDATVHLRGMWLTQIERVCKHLGIPLRRKRKWDMDTDEGMLSLDGSARGDAEDHIVLLKAGLIFDVDGVVWEPETFFKAFKFKPRALLVRA